MGSRTPVSLRAGVGGTGHETVSRETSWTRGTGQTERGEVRDRRRFPQEPRYSVKESNVDYILQGDLIETKVKWFVLFSWFYETFSSVRVRENYPITHPIITKLYLSFIFEVFLSVSPSPVSTPPTSLSLPSPPPSLSLSLALVLSCLLESPIQKTCRRVWDYEWTLDSSEILLLTSDGTGPGSCYSYSVGTLPQSRDVDHGNSLSVYDRPDTTVKPLWIHTKKVLTIFPGPEDPLARSRGEWDSDVQCIRRPFLCGPSRFGSVEYRPLARRRLGLKTLKETLPPHLPSLREMTITEKK